MPSDSDCTLLQKKPPHCPHITPPLSWSASSKSSSSSSKVTKLNDFLPQPSVWSLTVSSLTISQSPVVLTNWVCLSLSLTLFICESSKCLPEKIHNYTGCIYFAFPHCVFLLNQIGFVTFFCKRGRREGGGCTRLLFHLEFSLRRIGILHLSVFLVFSPPHQDFAPRCFLLSPHSSVNNVFFTSITVVFVHIAFDPLCTSGPNEVVFIIFIYNIYLQYIFTTRKLQNPVPHRGHQTIF